MLIWLQATFEETSKQPFHTRFKVWRSLPTFWKKPPNAKWKDKWETSPRKENAPTYDTWCFPHSHNFSEPKTRRLQHTSLTCPYYFFFYSLFSQFFLYILTICRNSLSYVIIFLDKTNRLRPLTCKGRLCLSRAHAALDKQGYP